MPIPKEFNFEAHFCEQLEKPFKSSKMTYQKRETKNIDLEYLTDDELLSRFLESTQKDELNELKIDVGDEWLTLIKQAIKKALNLDGKPLEKKAIFEIIREGIEVRGRRFRFYYEKPETARNPDLVKFYNSNIFSYVRQFAFNSTMESIDVVLFLNGLSIITIELKSELNGQNVDDAVSQYLKRDKKLPIFRVPFLHLAADTSKAKIAAQFVEDKAEDFVHFNTDVENTSSMEQNDYPVDYLYHDILRPESLIDIIEAYLFCFEGKDRAGFKFRKFLFPRYHQRRTVINLIRDLGAHFGKKRQLDKKYLIQHSPGSGKSYTIAVMQKFLRNAHVGTEHLLDSVIVVTDRINLDSQIKGTIGSSEVQSEMIKHAEKTSELAEALNKGTKVIISTIQKFSVKKLDELLKSQKGKRICFIIDEAHRSQAGKLHKHMVEKFDEDKGYQEEIIEGIGKRSYPNAVFVALTATPSDKTLEMFGKPFDIYSMEQAEKEGYILDVVKNVVTYVTLYKLDSELDSRNEYPPMTVSKKLKAKAFEDERVIQEKINIILRVFETQTKLKIDGKAKVMIVTSSRASAVKYKLLLDKALQERKSDFKALVAFSGSVILRDSVYAKGNPYTESNMNKISEEIEDEFNKREYRFIVVANKFQYGFNQPHLHTMFLDKAVSGINAVQTISRLNRVMTGKTDTLVVDFTNSYKAIVEAFSKFKGGVRDYSGVDVKELPRMREELLAQNVFTKADIEDFSAALLTDADPAATTRAMEKVRDNFERLPVLEMREFRSLLNRFNDTFAYLDNLVRIVDVDLRKFNQFTFYLARFIDPIGKGGRLEEELRNVHLKTYKIRLQKPEKVEIEPKTVRAKARRMVQYATIPEIVDAVNANYELALGDTEKSLVQRYIEGIAKDPFILSSIRANRTGDLERLYQTTIATQLKQRAIEFFMANNPARVVEYIERGVFKELNYEAFRMAEKELA